MADEAREYVRAAQEAELRGDAFTATELLIKAASIYRTTGRPHRALTMLKHARRIDGSRVDLDEQIRRLEWIPESPLESPLNVGALSLEAEMQRILAPLEATPPAPEEPPQLPGDLSRPLVERGPTRADPDARAWCSFCCNPGDEVGALIAGPAGAFACRSCLETSLGLLGHAPHGPEPKAAVEAGFVELPSQREAIAEIERLLGWGRRRILLVGPPGAGKSVVLEQAAAQVRGTFVRGAEPDALPTKDRPLFLEGPIESAALASHSAPVVFALRGTAPASSIRVEVDGRAVIVPGTVALHEAIGGALPLEMLESVDGIVVLAAFDEAQLAKLAEARLRSSGHDGEQVPELACVLAREAVASGRGAHELLALLRRVPVGARAPKRRGRAKKEKGA